VIEWERRVILKHYLDEGLSHTAIAHKLGVNRRTIYRLVRSGQLERDLEAEQAQYRPRPPVPKKIDAYRPMIAARLEAYPELSCIRLFEEIRAAGYSGGLTQVKLLVRKIRPRPVPEPLIRFETPPGKQAQVDFARFSFPWGVRYALLVVLGYSRLLWLRFYARQDMRTLMLGLEEAFHFFGGVPAELLFDQMKSVITRDLRLQGGALVKNAEFLRFAAHWDFKPRACRPYRAKTKGKVERPIRYLRGNFIYGREFISDGDLDTQRERWMTHVANVRLHQTIKERPLDRFEREERFTLRPLAVRPYHSLVLAPQPRSKRNEIYRSVMPEVNVERRPLAAYSQLAGGEA
jgi:transposase